LCWRDCSCHWSGSLCCSLLLSRGPNSRVDGASSAFGVSRSRGLLFYWFLGVCHTSVCIVVIVSVLQDGEVANADSAIMGVAFCIAGLVAWSAHEFVESGRIGLGLRNDWCHSWRDQRTRASESVEV